MKSSVILFFLLALLTGCKATGKKVNNIDWVDKQQKRGISLYKRGDYQGAFEQLHELASWGYKDAQYALAFMFLKGQYVEQSSLIGMGWFGVAVESNIPEWRRLHQELYQQASQQQQKKYDIIRADFVAKYGLEAQNVTCQKSNNGFSKRRVIRCIKDTSRRTQIYSVVKTEEELNIDGL